MPAQLREPRGPTAWLTTKTQAMSEHIFAYGANMCSEHLKEYSVSPEVPGEPACLVAHRLCFTKMSRDGSGKANLEPDLSSEVWGVLYSVPAAQLPILDRREGSGYARQQKVVHTARAAKVEAWVYVARASSATQALRPYEWYKRLLVEGAKEHGLPGSYLEALEAIEAVPDPDKVRDAEKRRLTCRGAR